MVVRLRYMKQEHGGELVTSDNGIKQVKMRPRSAPPRWERLRRPASLVPTSESRASYGHKRQVSCYDHKPLVRYEPNAVRNRLPSRAHTNKRRVGMHNKSTLSLGDPGVVSFSRFK